MKKIIIGIAAVMLGFAVNAAAVTWSITKIQDSPDVAATTGWLVQVFDSAVTYDYEKALAGTITAKFTGTTVDASGSYKATQKEMDVASANETVSIYAVIYDASTIGDAKNYIVSDVASKTVNAMGADLSIAFGAMNSTATANKFLNSSWQSVPEPTSGLLLLVGGALLALRRKQK